MRFSPSEFFGVYFLSSQEVEPFDSSWFRVFENVYAAPLVTPLILVQRGVSATAQYVQSRLSTPNVTPSLVESLGIQAV